MSEVAPLQRGDVGFFRVGQGGKVFLLVQLDEGKVLW